MTTVKKIVSRITLFYLITVALSVAIAGKIIYLQFFTDYKVKAKRFDTSTDSISANRGSIFSNDMRLLAVSIPKYEIYIDFYDMKTRFINNTNAKMNFYYKKEAINRRNRTNEQRKADTIAATKLVNNEIELLAKSLSDMFQEKTAAQYEYFIKTNCRNATDSSYRHVLVSKQHIDYNKLQQLKEFPIFRLGERLSGLITEERSPRSYTYGSFAKATIGDVNSKGVAIDGIERAFDSYLRGSKGFQRYMNIGIGKWMPINSGDNVFPESGYDVVTTLDIDIQETTEIALRKQIQTVNDAGIIIEGGTAIVMETKSGEIRAIANMKHNTNGNYNEEYNYALSETSAPGSTFKLSTLVALLDDGHVDLNTMVETKAKWEYRYKNKKDGKVLHEFKEFGGYNYGQIPVRTVFAKSSNVGFAKLTVQYYEDNPQKYFDKLFSMGLLKPLNLQISGENKQWLTLPGSSKHWQPQFLPLSSIGYQVTIAPIHTLAFYNAIANNGKMMKPKFVKEIRHHGQLIKTFPDEVIKNKICSTETLKQVREALKEVVIEGTAKKIGNTEFELAGKTGTAQRLVINPKTNKSVFVIKDQGVEWHAYQATFAGYVPANDPKYTIVVVLYSPLMRGDFTGGTYAAPVFKEIAEKLYATGIDWNNPVQRNNDSLLLPTIKHSQTQKIKNIASTLDLPFDSNTKNNEWVAVAKADSKLTTAKIQIEEDKVPSVINMGLRNATYLLEKAGLKVVASGKGKVKKQSINAGASLANVKGGTIYLELEI